MRKRAGDQIVVFDGKGGVYTCNITRADPKKTEFEIVQRQLYKTSSFFIHVALAPTKNIERIEWFLEKSIEVGIHQISFLICNNSERKKVNMDRMHKKAITAMKQSQNPFLPVINDLIPFNDFIKGLEINMERFICHADSGKDNHLIKKANTNAGYIVLIGPEGDFTQDELEMAEEHGFEAVSLGKTRLRTETAGFVACTLLNVINAQW
jgi:16S rRNA (uracil1498-N3)-methyltransferase